MVAVDVDFCVEEAFELDEPVSELLLEDSDEDDEVLVSFDSDLTLTSLTSLPSLVESLPPLPSFDSDPLETSLLLSLRESVR